MKPGVIEVVLNNLRLKMEEVCPLLQRSPLTFVTPYSQYMLHQHDEEPQEPSPPRGYQPPLHPSGYAGGGIAPVGGAASGFHGGHPAMHASYNPGAAMPAPAQTHSMRGAPAHAAPHAAPPHGPSPHGVQHHAAPSRSPQRSEHMCRLLTDRQEAPRARTEPSRDLAQVNLLFAFSSGLLLSPPFNIFQFLSILPHLPKSQQLHLACACFKRMFSE